LGPRLKEMEHLSSRLFVIVIKTRTYSFTL
jgi:hypothetical protein